MESKNELKEILPFPMFTTELSFICTKCNIEKPVSVFYKNITYKTEHLRNSETL
jgi:hypothetical protein